MERSIRSDSPKDTHKIGRRIGTKAQSGDVLLLVGDLGAGKTTLTQGILWGLGGTEYARSPTFVLVNEYPARLTMYHMDLYRLNSIEEIEDLGLDEYLYGNDLCVVEWADKAPGYFPVNHAVIQLEVIDDQTRRVTVSSETAYLDRLVMAIAGGADE
ncbi:MAG: tRNA (adenosine(37)-N6)-threonylcarbamoyltransferase complex ATPase subunit type 1 TsaE [SAR202 cluster bacterium]|jgi:tRNA threonylcarbamoyladenosine biosynthesis protein TsaE|nr:tRNA (adenosine(37)-N6)-threonylcarbamoyltransferase complex ATPase subunit type 1 TsaE [SAR202 cluster bacterium]